jgi:hypothetical protein
MQSEVPNAMDSLLTQLKSIYSNYKRTRCLLAPQLKCKHMRTAYNTAAYDESKQTAVSGDSEVEK